MSRPRTRPSRDETRDRLFQAAATVFVRSGIAGASIEDICIEAGLTRGALYSNFANKDELVLEMLNEHAQHNLEEMRRLSTITLTSTEFLEVLESPVRRQLGPLGTDHVLYMEFMLHAIRNPAHRARIAENHQRMRALTVEVLQRHSAALGLELPMEIEAAAAMINALDLGYSVHELIEPGVYEPGIFSRNLLVLQQLWVTAASAKPTPRSNVAVRNNTRRKPVK